MLQGAKNKKSEIYLFDKQEKQMIKKDESYKPEQIEANESSQNKNLEHIENRNFTDNEASLEC